MGAALLVLITARTACARIGTSTDAVGFPGVSRVSSWGLPAILAVTLWAVVTAMERWLACHMLESWRW